MKNAMMTAAEAAERIESGAVLMISGVEEVLATLPRGRWIGGTSVYFVTECGGQEDRDHVFVTELTSAEDARCRYLSADDLPALTEDRFDNGVSLILIPGMSRAHAEFALKGARYSGLFEQPLMGWISGVHVEEIGTKTPKIVDGSTGEMHDDGAVLLHVRLKTGRVADLDIVNLFEQDAASPTITFPESGFTACRAIVDGEDVDFADYVTRTGLDTKFPLVADYAGAMITVSFQNVDAEVGRVDFYAPVVGGLKYRLAKLPGRYADLFATRVQGDGGSELSCNCILNYIYGELEGRTTGSYTGPATFGEIAYILLNQTLVRLSVKAEQQSQVA